VWDIVLSMGPGPKRRIREHGVFKLGRHCTLGSFPLYYCLLDFSSFWKKCLALPCLALPYLTSPHLTLLLPYLTLPYFCLTLPYLTSYLTLRHLNVLFGLFYFILFYFILFYFILFYLFVLALELGWKCLFPSHKMLPDFENKALFYIK